MKYIRSVWHICLTLLFDSLYALTCGLQKRIGYARYASYRAAKLYPDYLKFGAAMQGVKPLAMRYCKGRGVDVGAGKWPLPGARPIESGEYENAYSISESDRSLDFVFSSHVLEHLSEPERALKEWQRVLKPGGVLFLYLPHPACEMWWPGNNPYHLWQPDPGELEDQLVKLGDYDVEYVSYLPDAFFSFVIIVRRKKC